MQFDFFPWLSVLTRVRCASESISKRTTQLYREGVNERKCFTSVTCGALYRDLRNGGHTCPIVPHAGHCCYAKRLVPLRSQESAGILLTHLSQDSPCGWAGWCRRWPGATGRCTLSTALSVSFSSGNGAGVRLQNAAEVALSSFATAARRNCCDTPPRTPTPR